MIPSVLLDVLPTAACLIEINRTVEPGNQHNRAEKDWRLHFVFKKPSQRSSTFGETMRVDGERIRSARERKPLTREELAHFAGVSESSVERAEAKKGTAGIYVLQQILPLLGLQVPDVLLDKTPSPRKKEQDDLKPVTIAGFTFRCRDPGMFQPFSVGDVELPVRRLMGGNGRIRYQYPDGIVCVEHASKFVLPPDIQRIASDILDRDRQSAQARRAPYEQRDMVRLDDYEPTMRDPDDAAWPLKLHVSITDFFATRVTNAHIDEALPNGGTIRTLHAGSPNDFRESSLANPLTVNLSLVTSDEMIFVAQRGEKVATSPGGWAPAVSGNANPKRDLVEGRYNPFLTAQREAGEEATEPYIPALSEITFFGLARTLTYYHPFLFGELRTPLTARELLSQIPADNWETQALIPLRFAIKPVTNWIRDHYLAAVDRKIPSFGIYTAIFSLLQSLLYSYPNDWQKVVAALLRNQPKREPRQKRATKKTPPNRKGRK